MNRAKKAAGEAAAELIQSNMLVGLGTGSTATYFIKSLGRRCREGLKIKAVATSLDSFELALRENIPLIDPEVIHTLDITVDGADEIDSQKRMIKGGGGALLKEKIVASMSTEMIVIVDITKAVDYLGRFPLPVEIIPFAFESTIYRLQKLGYQGKVRQTNTGERYTTDNGNHIYDIQLPYPCLTPEMDYRTLKDLAGVIEVGIFLNLAGRVIIGHPDGHIELRS